LELRTVNNHLVAITLLKQHDLRGTSIIEAYHARRLAPLMARTLPLYEMTPDTQLTGTVLA
jgi:hypothetical protein